MFYGYSRAFATVGLVLISFSTRTRSSPVIGLLPVSPLKDPGYVDLQWDKSDRYLAERDTNTFWHCGISPKLMIIETNHEMLGNSNSNEWNDYSTVSHDEKWQHTDLTWSVHDYAHFSPKKVNRCLRRALHHWSKAAPRLKFTQIENNAMNANLRIKFVGEMESGYSEGTIAHGFFPKDAERRMMEFHEDTPWRFKGGRGWNAQVIATHEFGHCLGLYHSKVVGAVMHRQVPFIDVEHFKLHRDDKKGIRHLYGDPKTSESKETTQACNCKEPTETNPKTSESKETTQACNCKESTETNPETSESKETTQACNCKKSTETSSSSSSSDDDYPGRLSGGWAGFGRYKENRFDPYTMLPFPRN